MKVRAKFVVDNITFTTCGTEVKLRTVAETSEENEKSFKLVPSGTIEMWIFKQDVAEDFIPGTEMYVDFTPVLNS